jgi:hypothetical protein
MRGHRLSFVAASDRSWRQPHQRRWAGRAEAASTTTEHPGTARQGGSGKRDGKVYERNQRPNAPQDAPPARTWRMWAGLQRAPTTLWRGELPNRLMSPVAGREASGKACGVPEARLLGHSWAPTPSNGLVVNMGTNLSLPPPEGHPLPAGTVHRPPLAMGWGGGPVVVRGRESRPHGEGVQRVRSIHATPGGRW